MKSLNEQLSKVHCQIQRQAARKTADAFKGTRWLLVRNRDTLSLEQVQQLLIALKIGACKNQHPTE